ncbi:hypothetical protein C2845_PM04G12560 [Panicum miliaceum]|uniref:Ionotropic glutamate receptor C-terminal domain-containing protein n=1 Tax=Panicum miliaceum TaxID=4540 RepID=A0A3L6QNB9_PANMI|nr:hypothetical protein C2845_PM04G12560 [Panicum miliaceum]
MGGNIIISVLVLQTSWLLFASHDQPGLLGRAQQSDAAAVSSVVHVGALLDLGSAGGRASRASISLALEDFYASQPPGSGTTVALHVADCKDDEITALLQQMKVELNKLKTMQARVFVVHMSLNIAARLFVLAHDAEMLADGYAWVLTDSALCSDYVTQSDKLLTFPARFLSWYRQQNPTTPDPANPNIFHLWAYGTAWAIMTALRKAGPLTLGLKMPSSQNSNNSNDLSMLGVSQDGPGLIDSIRATRFQGISGEFVLVDGQRQGSVFEIFNVIGNSYRRIGFWTPDLGLTKKLITSSDASDNVGLNTVIWPGGSAQPPRGWEWPVAGKKLKIAVPVKPAPNPFVNVKKNLSTGKFDVTGYCIDIFEAVMQEMPYAVPCFVIWLVEHKESRDFGGSAGKQLVNIAYFSFQIYDAAIGDITIRYNRTSYADFTLHYTESGVAMIVPVKDDTNKKAWVFLKPLTTDLWFGSIAFFIYTGIVIWLLERRINNAELTGERVDSILSRLVVIVWVLVLLVITSSYTANLSSILTVQQLQPTETDVHELIKKGEYVGYHNGSYVGDLLEELGFDRRKAFPKRSPMVNDFSRTILSMTEGDAIIQIEKKWIRDQHACQNDGAIASPSSLNFKSFSGLFLVTGVASTSALLIALVMLLYKNKHKIRNSISESRLREDMDQSMQADRIKKEN